MSITGLMRLVAATMVLASLNGCRRAPELKPRLILQGEPVGNGFWLAAPYVAAVRIVRADLVGARESIFQGGPKVLQLIRFSANVENVIKGNLPEKTITFFFFVKTDQNPYYYLYPRKRYIVSLRNEGGVLRSWADASQLDIEVFSGAHNQKDLPLDLGPEATIAYILLTPGIDCDLNEFSHTLRWPLYGDPSYVNQRLAQLQLSSNAVLRNSGCLTAAIIFSGLVPRCLQQLLSSPDAGLRQEAARFLKGDSANLALVLRKNPFYLFPAPWTDYMTQMFEIYAEDLRPEVREAACESLRRFAPQQAVKHCK